MSILTRVNTGEKTEYLFRTSTTGGAVYVELVKRGGDERDASPYTEYDGKGRTAIVRLAEAHEQFFRLFLSVRALANFDPHGRFLGFKDLDEVRDEPELMGLWEGLGEVFEATADYEGLEQ